MMAHYLRVSGEDPLPPLFQERNFKARSLLTALYASVSPFLIVGGVLFVLLQATSSLPLSGVSVWAVPILFYSLFRLCALAYISIFMGRLEGRVYYSLYLGLFIVGVVAISDSLRGLQTWRLPMLQKRHA